MVLNNTAASLLLVPSEGNNDVEIAYRRLIVPLDGSCRAESVLPFAVRIARNHGAELLLVHVIPKPEIMVAGMHDAEAIEFTMKLEQFNEQNARTYLDRMQRRLASGGIAVRAIIENEGDVRERLLLVAEHQHADLIVMSARGKGAIHDMPCGNVARHIAANTKLPLLLIRQQMSKPVAQLKPAEQHYEPRLFWESAH
jgi:nucleotide-binding universal stress UspA family protein